MKEVQLFRSFGIPLKVVALVDDEDYQRILNAPKSNNMWHLNSGYAIAWCKTKEGSKKCLMHRIILSCLDSDLSVDHINHNILDNQKANLRLIKHQQNRFNSNISRANKKHGVIYKGVTFHHSKYYAYVKHNGIKISCGKFITQEEAAQAYNTKALELYGEFAKLNEIDWGPYSSKNPDGLKEIKL